MVVEKLLICVVISVVQLPNELKLNSNSPFWKSPLALTGWQFFQQKIIWFLAQKFVLEVIFDNQSKLREIIDKNYFLVQVLNIQNNIIIWELNFYDIKNVQILIILNQTVTAPINNGIRLFIRKFSRILIRGSFWRCWSIYIARAPRYSCWIQIFERVNLCVSSRNSENNHSFRFHVTFQQKYTLSEK